MGAERPFRILSLDGGGSWALLQVMALKEIYGADTRGHDVLKDFDLVAGTSGGSLTLGGLLTDKTLDDILVENYLQEEKRRSVFAPLTFALDPLESGRPFRTIWNWLMQRVASLGAKYRTEAKLKGLKALLAPHGDMSLPLLREMVRKAKGHAPHLLVVGFDYDTQRAKFFRSDAGSLSGSGPSLSFGKTFRDDFAAVSRKRAPSLAEVIHASSNAPVTFFMSPAEIGEERFWDGAIGGYNNPVLAAVTEALANRARSEYGNGEIHVLSIGTGSVKRPTSGRAADRRLVQTLRKQPTLHADLKQLAMAILDDPPDSASYVAHVVLGQPLPDLSATPPVLPPVSGTVVRMSPLIRPRRDTPNDPWRLPPALAIDEFLAIEMLEMDATGAQDVDLLVKAGNLWLAGEIDNQPIRENGDHECQIGHIRFGDARDAWLALMSRGG